MNTQTLTAIQAILPQIQVAVAKWQTASRNWPKTLKNSWRGDEGIFSSVSASLGPAADTISQAELALAIAVVCAGRMDDGPPPFYVWMQLSHLIQEHIVAPGRVTTPEAVCDVVIGYGVGWGREVELGQGGWDDDWDTAFYFVSEIAGSAMNETFKLLRALGYSRFNLSAEERAEAQAEALAITLQIIRNQPRGKHGEQITNGLSHWQPKQPTLSGFIELAVRGRVVKDGKGERRLQGGSFRDSEIFPALKDTFGLLVDRVEFRVCHLCHKELLERHEKACLASYHTKPHHPPKLQIKGVKGKGLYQSSQHSCPDCGGGFEARATYTVARKNWIVLPVDRGGAYELQDRYRCNNCNNLHSPVGVCPIAWHQHWPPARSPDATHLWIHRPSAGGPAASTVNSWLP